MANTSYVDTFTGALKADVKLAIHNIFDYTLNNWRLGHCSPGTRTENAQLYSIEGTTPSVANTEFSIQHGLGFAPYLALPCLALDSVGAQWVQLTTTRVADAQRVYLSSSVVNAPIRILIEG